MLMVVEFPSGPRSVEREEVKVGVRDAPLCSAFPLTVRERVAGVQWLATDALKEVVTHVLDTMGEAGRDNLKPHNMAQVRPLAAGGRARATAFVPTPRCQRSPHMFWSLVRLHGGVEAGLRALLPDVDWSFLSERTRRLSERGKLAQETEAGRRRASAPPRMLTLVVRQGFFQRGARGARAAAAAAAQHGATATGAPVPAQAAASGSNGAVQQASASAPAAEGGDDIGRSEVAVADIFGALALLHDDNAVTDAVASRRRHDAGPARSRVGQSACLV